MLYAVPTAEFGALLLKCVLIVYIWPEQGVFYIQLVVNSRDNVSAGQAAPYNFSQGQCF